MVKLLTHPWLVRGLGLIAIAVIVLLIGPLVAIGEWRPLESLAARWGLIAVIAAATIGKRVLAARRAAKAEAGFVDEMTTPAASEGADQEVAILRERFEGALRVLKKARGNGGRLSLYDLPWYVIIGPPGSGKTTALVSSGLRFPLGEEFGPNAIRGVGGTRHCDWWFTDEAVLIDTAGRYTTQDSHASADSAAWSGFLDLLKKYRRRRPLNGVLVALSIADLLTQSDAERHAHAAAIKARIAELDRHFGLRLPVYLLLTKCDLVAGFEPFFAELTRGEREQVLGVTFAYADAAGVDPTANLGAELDRLIRRLNERVIARVAAESEAARRASVLGFPKQMAALKPTLMSFVEEVFRGSRYDHAALLRGVYFTSGTQEGTPIDKLLGTLARRFGIDAGRVAPQHGAGKSYFITDVLRKVAFGEANLAGTNRRVELRRAWQQRGAYAGIAALVVLLGAAWGLAYLQAHADMRAMSAALADAEARIGAAERAGEDLLAVLPALDAVRALPGGYADRLEGGSWLRGFGLSQTDKLGERAVATYRRLLRELLLPRLMLRLERQLERGGPSPDYTYEALKAYLMLGSDEHYDPEAIQAFIRADWSTSLPRQISAAQREALDGHLDALFEARPLPLPIPIAEHVVEQARREVRALPLEARIYGRLKRTFAAATAGFSLRDAGGGPAAELVFVRKSGRPLSEPLAPLFTKDSYRQVFVERSRELTTELAAEAWVLGATEALDGAERDALLAKVRELYLDEFAEAYTAALLDVSLAPFSSADEAARIFNVLSRDDSPLVRLLEAIARQTALDQPDDAPGLAARAGDRVERLQERLTQILGATPAATGAAEPPAANAVEARFGPLTALVRSAEGQPRPIQHLTGLLAELYRYLGVVASEAAGGAIPPHVQQNGQSLLQQLRMEASTQPALFVGELLQVAASRTAALTTGGLRAYLNELWQAGPLAVCRRAIDGRYPLEPSREQAVRLDDFAEFFGYGGTLDAFFNTHLRQYVDATTSPWRPRATANLPIRLSDAALQAFENADVIKRTFFRAGSMTPSIAFDLRPLEMDTSLSRFLLELEGATITYEFGPQIPTLMQWPGPNPGTEVRIELRDRQSGATAMERFQGPWAWFRLLDRSSLRPTDVPEQFEVTFSHGGRNVLYGLTARSAFNPFALPQLEQFRCPATL